mmetsp:Transcript_2214/g.5243  ORF Transcript_2214/g.5243 Transcript_2214/m.5243 type:complete len:785 (-) Transcript_2214:488-2842(-)|eukprot:CAMPEP_0178986628 /NCGR_PEP_ID=MMETSP0795-20121207/2808_1 /TAXON_ID=88552 /ORGANISM="Amoebophrya sp., Strain Ameob2" /LENGTH=784 /DNA_ID=CAMNT_0020677707 /DNA_START=197 /DNA_END=2551 /DNA_ORIENTATION=-
MVAEDESSRNPSGSESEPIKRKLGKFADQNVEVVRKDATTQYHEADGGDDGDEQNTFVDSINPVKFYDRARRILGWRLGSLLALTAFLLRGAAYQTTYRSFDFGMRFYGINGPRSQLYHNILSGVFMLQPLWGIMSDSLPFERKKLPFCVAASLIAMAALGYTAIRGGSLYEHDRAHETFKHDSENNAYIREHAVPVLLFVLSLAAGFLQNAVCGLFTDARYTDIIRNRPKCGPTVIMYSWTNNVLGQIFSIVAMGWVIEYYGHFAIMYVVLGLAVIGTIPFLLGWLREGHDDGEDVFQEDEARRQARREKRALRKAAALENNYGGVAQAGAAGGGVAREESSASSAPDAGANLTFGANVVRSPVGLAMGRNSAILANAAAQYNVPGSSDAMSSSASSSSNSGDEGGTRTRAADDPMTSEMEAGAESPVSPHRGRHQRQRGNKRAKPVPPELTALAIYIVCTAVGMIVVSLANLTPVKTALISGALGLTAMILAGCLLTPVLARVMWFFFIGPSFTFTIDGAIFYFMIDTKEQYPQGPGFSTMFVATWLPLFCNVFNLFGFWFYSSFMRHCRVYLLLYTSSVIGLVCNLAGALQFSRVAPSAAADSVLILLSAAIYEFSHVWCMLSYFAIMSLLCPRNLEAIMLALMHAITLMGFAQGRAHGAMVLELLGVRPSGQKDEGAQFENLWKAALIHSFMLMLPMLVLPWFIPNVHLTENFAQKSAVSGSIFRRAYGAPAEGDRGIEGGVETTETGAEDRDGEREKVGNDLERIQQRLTDGGEEGERS